jgi:pilus assembly protein CpaC
MRVHIVLLILLVLVGAPVWAVKAEQGSPVAPAPSQEMAPPPPMEVPESLHLMVGRSLIISSPTRIKRISIANPAIADAVLVSPYQILINGKVPGGVSLVIWDEFDQTQTFDLFVDLDIMELSRKIQEVFPEEPIAIEASKDVVILSGRASSEAVADKIFEVVSAATPKVISLMEVPTAPTRGEILLEVRFAEVDRSVLDEHGLNIFSTGGANTIGTLSTQQFSAPSLSSLSTSRNVGESSGITDINFRFSDLLNIFIFRPDIEVGLMLRALNQQNLLEILAQPNLLTQTGKEASFLAGGEFPVPIVQGTGGGLPTVTIQFKEFGVRLTFTPTLTVDDTIHLKVAPEVSTLDFANAVSIQGFLVPALSTRRVETEMELKDGQSFAIAGLVDDRVTQVINKVPVLGDIPILGHLFRSRSRSKSKAELLVVVTPRIVRPAPEQPLPEEPAFPEEVLPPAGQEESPPSEEEPSSDG